MKQFLEDRRRTGEQLYRIPDVCGTKLIGYAESFRQLAKSFGQEESEEPQDRRGILEEERLKENCQVIAGHLNELAAIMDQTADQVSGLEPLEDRTWKKLSRAFRDEGIILEGACLVPGENKEYHLSLRLRSVCPERVPGERVEEMLEVLLGKRLCLSLACPEFVGRESRSYLFVEQPRYMALTGFARVVKSQEMISGDNYSILQEERGKLSLLLSDGTGSGEQASKGSSWVLDLAENLLETGYSPEAVMRLINSTAITKSDEVGHPTLDMCCMDLRRGSCEFWKAGGAVSFRKRGSEVEQISGGQLPLGIFQDMEPRRQYLKLREGDCLIQVTDGVLEAFREKGYEEAVRNYLAGMEEENPREVAEKLMQLAIFSSEGNVRDDMTILTATLWKNP